MPTGPTKAVRDDHLPYTPQYPLWSDGAVKRRFIHVPPGTWIDASDPDAWRFPVGTKLWKEFRFHGRPVETRYIENTAEGWRYAAYAWSDDESEAVLAPERGIARSVEIADGVHHSIPSRYDCRACHEGRPVPVLGFTALQLSPDRDEGAPHAEAPRPGDLDLRVLVERGLVRGLPHRLLATPPRIAARSSTERAALGYLYANCAMCHNASGPLSSLGLSLDYAEARGGATRRRSGARWVSPATSGCRARPTSAASACGPASPTAARSSSGWRRAPRRRRCPRSGRGWWTRMRSG